MPFSVLLLTAANTGKHITGAGSDRVTAKLESGEFALFFDKLDTTDTVRQGLGMLPEQKCCDGIIFYAQGAMKVICLVEMKHSRVENAAKQIKETYDHLYKKLKHDCQNCKSVFDDIIWRAYIYYAGSSSTDIEKCKEELRQSFAHGNITVSNKADITAFLRGISGAGKQKKRR